MSILTVKFGLNSMLFNEATPHISVNCSRCPALPEPNLFPIKGNTILLTSKNEQKKCFV